MEITTKKLVNNTNYASLYVQHLFGLMNLHKLSRIAYSRIVEILDHFYITSKKNYTWSPSQI